MKQLNKLERRSACVEADETETRGTYCHATIHRTGHSSSRSSSRSSSSSSSSSSGMNSYSTNITPAAVASSCTQQQDYDAHL
ncbi:hypothetical protein FHG87_002305 [Trinorchestia longiramus]|nr:hypothetical protein FHG87_002305 [Trinorchestia longiramus]